MTNTGTTAPAALLVLALSFLALLVTINVTVSETPVVIFLVTGFASLAVFMWALTRPQS